MATFVQPNFNREFPPLPGTLTGAAAASIDELMRDIQAETTDPEDDWDLQGASIDDLVLGTRARTVLPEDNWVDAAEGMTYEELMADIEELFGDENEDQGPGEGGRILEQLHPPEDLLRDNLPPRDRSQS